MGKYQKQGRTYHALHVSLTTRTKIWITPKSKCIDLIHKEYVCLYFTIVYLSNDEKIITGLSYKSYAYYKEIICENGYIQFVFCLK